MNKICRHCDTEKSVEQFSKKGINKDGTVKYQDWCRSCNNEYHKEHYKNNKQDYLDKAARNRNTARRKAYDYIEGYLKQHPCIDCGETDPIALEFDHINPKDKSNNISTLIQHNYPINKIQEEIDKCEVRCCNCHRRKTAKQFFKFKYVRFD